MGALGRDWKPWFYFIFIQLGGAATTVLLLTLLWRTKTRKNPTLISLVFSWWFSAYPCLCILLYTSAVTGPPPSFTTCLTSAVFTMPQATMTAITPFSLTFHVWLLVKRIVDNKHGAPQPPAWLVAFLVVIPYIGFLVVMVAVILIGTRHPELVSRAHFYCTVNDDTLTTVMSVFGAIALLAAIIFAIWTLVILRRHKARLVQGGADLSLILRVLVFGVYIFIGICFNVVSINDWSNPIPDLWLSTCGLAVFFIFGTSSDVRNTWRGAYTRASRSQQLSHLASVQHPTRSSPKLEIAIEHSVAVSKEDSFLPTLARDSVGPAYGYGSGGGRGDHGAVPVVNVAFEVDKISPHEKL